MLEQLRLFVREDGKRIEQNGIRVEKGEKTVSAELEVPGLERRVVIKGRLDRLEREGDLLRVVDYKTGVPFPTRLRLNEAAGPEGSFPAG